MFKTKRTRITAYLQTAAPTPFNDLLSDWHCGLMREKLENLELRRQEHHIDWLPDYKCINIQARYRKLYVDIQIDQKAFTIALDADEPDEAAEYPLLSADDFYETVRRCLDKLR